MTRGQILYTYGKLSKKDGIAIFLGEATNLVSVTSRCLNGESDTVRWNLEAPRASLQEVLRCSGYRDCLVAVSQAEEASLRVHPVFVSATNAAVVRQKLSGLDHAGVVGPTRTGAYIVCAPKEI